MTSLNSPGLILRNPESSPFLKNKLETLSFSGSKEYYANNSFLTPEDLLWTIPLNSSGKWGENGVIYSPSQKFFILIPRSPFFLEEFRRVTSPAPLFPPLLSKIIIRTIFLMIWEKDNPIVFLNNFVRG